METKKLETDKKVFLGSLLYGIIEDGVIREPNLSSFRKILSRYAQEGYDVSGFENLTDDYSQFENLAKTTAADIMLKTKRVSRHLVDICRNFENRLLGYIDAAVGSRG